MIFWKIILEFALFELFVGGEKWENVELEPGQAKQEYETVEEVRGHDNNTSSEKPAEDEHLLREAILDVAYYLRRFKFRGFDPRYLTEGDIPTYNLFVEFPSPPLRNIHWEVKKFCESSFSECVNYLQEQVSQTVLPRHLDSLTITKQNEWRFPEHNDLIKSADEECLKLLEKDDKTFNVFSSPLQRFQWLTSASYYMCYFTMKEVSYLKTFDLECDDFASCIQWDIGLSNRDVRGNNDIPFACAFYSFCPDPCCPLRYLPDPVACSEINPCAMYSGNANTNCGFKRNENTNLESIMMNQWNISCQCHIPGIEWDSRSGMCVDTDECSKSKPVCNFPSESCRNLPGSYKCVCSAMGYRRNLETKACERDPLMEHVLYPPYDPHVKENKSISSTFHDFINKFKSMMSVSLVGNEIDPNKTETP